MKKMIKLRIAVLILFVSTSVGLFAQQFGGNPSSVKWNQVNTDSVRIIFPTGLEKQAMEIADISTRLGKLTDYSIGKGFRKINIILQNQTTISNGYVSLGPPRTFNWYSPVVFSEVSLLCNIVN